MEIEVVDLHTSGEPVRIVTGGYPELQGTSIEEKKNDALKNHDAIRRAIMLEPRGHAEMFGMIPVPTSNPKAAIGALFIHTTGYSTMSGHGLIAFCRWAVESGRVPMHEPVTEFGVELPCGVVDVTCVIEAGKVISTTFDSVPAFLSLRDAVVNVPGLSQVTLDVAYGGAYYAILTASSIGLSLKETDMEELIRVTTAINDAAREQLNIPHTISPSSSYLFGTMLIDDAACDEATVHLCIFAGRQIDRSPTGGGVVSRMARDHARGLIGMHAHRQFYGPTPVPFDAEIVGELREASIPAVTVRVTGSASFVGRSTYIIDPQDSLTYGFNLPRRYSEMML